MRLCRATVRRAIRPAGLSAAALVLSACATTTLEGDGEKTPLSRHGVHTAHASFYGFDWSTPPVDKCANGQGLYRVRSHTNAGYALVSLLSLGFYVPQTLEWWCDGGRPPSPDDAEEELYRPGS
jgi:hypothetical protein